MKLKVTSITRIIVFLMGFALFTLLVVLFPELAREETVGKVNPPSAVPFLISTWVFALPIFAALFQMLRLLSYIDAGNAFTSVSRIALRNIKYSAFVFNIILISGAVSVIVIAKRIDPSEDVTPVVTIAFILSFATSVIATFIAVLEKLVQSAIEMKDENDLTI